MTGGHVRGDDLASMLFSVCRAVMRVGAMGVCGPELMSEIASLDVYPASSGAGAVKLFSQ